MACLRRQRHLVNTFCIFSFLSEYCLFDRSEKSSSKEEECKRKCRQLFFLCLIYSCIFLHFAMVDWSCKSSVMMSNPIVRLGSRQFMERMPFGNICRSLHEKTETRKIRKVSTPASHRRDLFFSPVNFFPLKTKTKRRSIISLSPLFFVISWKGLVVFSSVSNLGSFCSQEALPIFPPSSIVPFNWLTTDYLTHSPYLSTLTLSVIY